MDFKETSYQLPDIKKVEEKEDKSFDYDLEKRKETSMCLKNIVKTGKKWSMHIGGFLSLSPRMFL